MSTSLESRVSCGVARGFRHRPTGTAIRQSQGLCCAKGIMLMLHKHGFLLRVCVLRQAGGGPTGLSYAYGVQNTVWNTAPATLTRSHQPAKLVTVL